MLSFYCSFYKGDNLFYVYYQFFPHVIVIPLIRDVTMRNLAFENKKFMQRLFY